MGGMEQTSQKKRRALRFAALFFLPMILSAQVAGGGTNPLEDFLARVAAILTGPAAMWISLIAIVFAGVTLCFGEGRSKSVVVSVCFGIVMIMGAARMVAWMS